MVIRGNNRGNGSQLARYLTTKGDNEAIRILDVDGSPDATDKQLHDTLLSMSLMSELTKSDKGLYHAQINPAYGEDKAMTDSDWQQAADMLGKALGFDHQRRAIVLHEKKGRVHAHVVWERYDYQTGKMIDTSFNYHAHDRARQEMERIFAQEQTPKKNKRQPELKEHLTQLWNNTETAAEFIKQVEQSGYLLAAGVVKRPFMVVDDTGRSFDLVRQLTGIKTKAVRERLKGYYLIPEKQAIEQMRQRKEEKTLSLQKTESRDLTALADDFADNKTKMLAGEKKKEHAAMYAQTKQQTLTPQGTEAPNSKQAIAQSFADNRNTALSREERKQALIAEMKAQFTTHQKNRSHDREM